MKLEIYPEECCEICNETIHNHIVCPVCKDAYAGTEAYHDIYERVMFPWASEAPDLDYILACKCGALFALREVGQGGSLFDFEWEHINA